MSEGGLHIRQIDITGLIFSIHCPYEGNRQIRHIAVWWIFVRSARPRHFTHLPPPVVRLPQFRHIELSGVSFPCLRHFECQGGYSFDDVNEEGLHIRQIDVTGLMFSIHCLHEGNSQIRHIAVWWIFVRSAQPHKIFVRLARPRNFVWAFV